MLNTIYHRFLLRPYILNSITPKTNGTRPVVFLHGINSSAANWQHVLPHLPDSCQPVLIDLAGFGDSPKPHWPKYSTKFHAKQVAYTLRKLKIKHPIILVGHSMGGLVAVELAKKNPSKYSNLVLVNTPLYNHKQVNKELSRYKHSKIQASNILFALYDKLIEEKDLTLKSAKQILKIAPKDSAFKLTEETWNSFEKSLQNTIMKQNTVSDIKKMTQRIYFMNGVSDLFIINKNQIKLASNYENIEIDFLPSGHMINRLSGKKIAQKISKILSSSQKDSDSL